MERAEFDARLRRLMREHEELVTRKNTVAGGGNGVFERYANPVLTAAHAPVFWRYDLSHETNPHLLERMGVNAAFNSGAIEFGGKILLAVRVEGADRKSFFAVAESENGVDNFRFRDYPVLMPETGRPGHERLRHAPRAARGRLGLRPLLHGAQRPARAARRPVVGHRAVRHLAHEGLADVGAPARLEDALAAAAQRRPAPRAGRRQVRLLHAPAGRLHRGRVGRRHRLGFVRAASSTPRRGRDGHRPARCTTPSRSRRTASAPRRSRPSGAGCTSRTACAAPPPGCATCSISSCATSRSRGA